MVVIKNKLFSFHKWMRAWSLFTCLPWWQVVRGINDVFQESQLQTIRDSFWRQNMPSDHAVKWQVTQQHFSGAAHASKNATLNRSQTWHSCHPCLEVSQDFSRSLFYKSKIKHIFWLMNGTAQAVFLIGHLSSLHQGVGLPASLKDWRPCRYSQTADARHRKCPLGSARKLHRSGCN